MKCPHCTTTIYDNPIFSPIIDDSEGKWGVSFQNCPACKKSIICLLRTNGWTAPAGKHIPQNTQYVQLIRPKCPNRGPVPTEIPPTIAQDYTEACTVLTDSPKASAALSRRCLQCLLRDKAGVKHSDLSKEIQEVLDSKTLPQYLSNHLDAVRNIGNFAAHPIKSTTTGAIMDVESGEAEWTLDVLEALFDFYYVEPAKLAAKTAALNKKLADAGKPPMKS